MPFRRVSLRATQAAVLLLLAVSMPAHSFFFSTGRAKSQAPQWFGIRDYGVPAQAAYSYDSSGGVTVAVPVAIPLPSHQMAPPYPGLAPVQLVPCLCPISKDPDAVKPMPGSAPPGSMHATSAVMHMQTAPAPQAVQAAQAAPANQQQQQ